jgi:hypothetical protein
LVGGRKMRMKKPLLGEALMGNTPGWMAARPPPARRFFASGDFTLAGEQSLVKPNLEPYADVILVALALVH